MWKKILIGFGALLFVFLAFVGLKSGDYKISRDITITASPAIVFPYINNSFKLNAWMPWKASDPQMQISYAGPAEGRGATTRWISEGKMGVGSAEIIETVPNEKTKTKLTYEKPMAMEQTSEMTLTPQGEGAETSTKVTWMVYGKNGFMGRLFCLFKDMDKMVGGEFEKGLASLKTQVESEAATATTQPPAVVPAQKTKSAPKKK